MKSVKKIIFFLAIAVIFICFWINVIFINSLNSVNTQVIDRLGKIYINLDDIANKETRSTLVKILDSNNSGVYKNLLNQNDPVANFYGFCGFMKTNQKEAMEKLDIIMSDRDCTIVIDNREIKSYLGYAILLLLYNTPDWLTNTPSDSFEEMSKKYILQSFKSERIAKLNYFDYYSLAVRLAAEKYGDTQVTGELTLEIIGKAENNKLNEQSELSLAELLPYFPADKQQLFMKRLLQSKYEESTKKALHIIGTSAPDDIISILENIIKNSKNDEILMLAIEKYAGILKRRSFPLLERMMLRNTTKLVVKCLEQIGLYGADSEYDFLRKYLSNIYSPDVNIAALDAITTSLKTSRAKKKEAAALVIRNSNKPSVAQRAIEYHLDNSITDNHGLIFTRLRQKETIAMKQLTIDYISHFRLTSGIWLLQQLAADTNKDIREKANKLILDLSDEP